MMPGSGIRLKSYKKSLNFVKENFIQRLLRSWKEYLKVYLMLAVQLLTTYSSDLYRYLSLRYVVKLQYRRGLYRLRTSTLLHRRRLRSCKSLHYSSGWRTISNRAIECKTQKIHFLRNDFVCDIHIGFCLLHTSFGCRMVIGRISLTILCKKYANY